ncbi:MAG: MarR family transcriptional regulator [Pseudomonadota bacterium]
MPNNHSLAHELDRVMRKIDARMHKSMPSVDTGRIGPMGGLLLMQLHSMQPCKIQVLATAMGRDNSQLTRLTRDLEAKGILKREPSPDDKRATLLSVTELGKDFIREMKTVLTDVVNDVAKELSDEETKTLIQLLQKL